MHDIEFRQKRVLSSQELEDQQERLQQLLDKLPDDLLYRLEEIEDALSEIDRLLDESRDSSPQSDQTLPGVRKHIFETHRRVACI